MTSTHTSAVGSRLRRWTLRRRVAASFGVLAVLLGLTATLSVVSIMDFSRRGQEVIDTWTPAVLTSQNVFSDLVNQETGVRGYALSGLDEFLEPYQKYAAQEVADVRKLRGYLRGHSTTLAELESVEQAAATWRTQTAEPIIALVRAGDPRAADRVNGATGKTRFDTIRTRAATLTATVQGLNADALDGRELARVRSFVALGTAAALIAVAVLMLWLGLHRWVLQPVDQLAAQTRDVAAGDLNRAIVPTGPPEFVRLSEDVEMMRRRIADELATAETARRALIVRTAELVRSNLDLEQFAYVASHDLSEPLRKVSNFCQLLERQYSDQLDDRARQYIYFAVDGAKRMQALINDLLAFSRVGRTTDGFVEVDAAAVMTVVAAELREQIEGSGAEINYDELPTVWADQTLFTALLVNLVGNAIKYRGTDPPRITISAQRSAQGSDGWLFTVSDNGIGIDPQYAERIFAIFQRLHVRDEYGGTGIGLALCRKIVEFHGGRIWLDPASAAGGATFRFTIAEGTANDR
jgi:signal transduction histidine kinase